MDVKKLALLVGALVIAVITAVMAKNMFAGAGAQQAVAAPAVPVGPKVLVAKKALPVGTIIDADSFSFQPWPKELMQSAYYVEGQPDATTLAGTVVRYPIAAGQPVTRGSLVGPEDRGFLAAALGPGMRAVTVPVNSSTGVAGFVFPGDHVDLVLTQQVQGGGEGSPLKVSETIVRNVRVLATDQRSPTRMRTERPPCGRSPTSPWKSLRGSPRKSPSRRASVRCPCRCGRLPTTRRISSVRLPQARSRSRQTPTRLRSGRCFSPTPIARSIPTRPSPRAETSRASSAGRSLLGLPLPESRSDRRWSRVSVRLLVVSQEHRFRLGPSSASLAAIMSPLFRWELAK
jgi:Flp pilus assembly protein CpaB